VTRQRIPVKAVPQEPDPLSPDIPDAPDSNEEILD
jgi:hypothetical protein